MPCPELKDCPEIPALCIWLAGYMALAFITSNSKFQRGRRRPGS